MNSECYNDHSNILGSRNSQNCNYRLNYVRKSIFDSTIVFSTCELVGKHLSMCRIPKENLFILIFDIIMKFFY